MNPNDTDGHQFGNGLGAEQSNVGMAPNTGMSPNAGQTINAQQSDTFTPSAGSVYNAPQAPIISSSPDPEDKKESSITRAFGGRSRASKIAAQAPTQPSQLRQNAPEFFQQGMQRQDVAFNMAAEQKAKSKKGLLIGGIIGGVALLAAAVAVIVVSVASNTATQEETLATIINDNDIAAISDFETEILHIYNKEIDSSDIFGDNFKDSIQNGAISYRKVYDSLKNELNKIKDDTLKERTNKIVQSMGANVEQYELASKNYLVIYESIMNNDSSKLDNIENPNIKKSAQELLKSKIELDEILSALDNVNCNNAKILNPATGYDECDQLDDRYEAAESIIEDNNLAMALFFGENPKNIKDNIVKSSLAELYVILQESKDSND